MCSYSTTSGQDRSEQGNSFWSRKSRLSLDGAGGNDAVAAHRLQKTSWCFPLSLQLSWSRHEGTPRYVLLLRDVSCDAAPFEAAAKNKQTGGGISPATTLYFNHFILSVHLWSFVCHQRAKNASSIHIGDEEEKFWSKQSLVSMIISLNYTVYLESNKHRICVYWYGIDWYSMFVCGWINTLLEWNYSCLNFSHINLSINEVASVQLFFLKKHLLKVSWPSHGVMNKLLNTF